MLRNLIVMWMLTVSVTARAQTGQAKTPREMVEESLAHTRETYLNKTCKFRWYLTGEFNHMLAVEGTLAFNGDKRRVELKESNTDGVTGKPVWTHFRYYFDGTHLFENVINNGVVAPVAEKEQRWRINQLRVWTPWDIERLVVGSGEKSLPELLADENNNLVLVKESPDEVIVDLTRGGTVWTTFTLDPRNHYAITRMSVEYSKEMFQQRTMTYRDGLITGLEMRKDRRGDFVAEYEWTGQSNPADFSDEAIADVGDTILREINGERKAFQKTAAGINAVAMVDLGRGNQASLDTGHKPGPSKPVDLPSKNSDALANQIFVSAVGATLALAVAAFIFVRRKGKQ